MIILSFLTLFNAFEEKYEPFLLENTSNLTYEFFMTILTRQFKKIFLLKVPFKISCVNFDAFSRQNNFFIFPQNGGAQMRKCIYILF